MLMLCFLETGGLKHTLYIKAATGDFTEGVTGNTVSHFTPLKRNPVPS